MNPSEIRHQMVSANADTQRQYARHIMMFANVPLRDVYPIPKAFAEDWALVFVEAEKHRAKADYLEAVAWFFAEERPSDAMDKLIDAKLKAIPKGTRDDFWYMMEMVLQ